MDGVYRIDTESKTCRRKGPKKTMGNSRPEKLKKKERENNGVIKYKKNREKWLKKKRINN